MRSLSSLMGSAILLQAFKPLCLSTLLWNQAFFESLATSGPRKAYNCRDSSLAVDTHWNMGSWPPPRSGLAGICSV